MKDNKAYEVNEKDLTLVVGGMGGEACPYFNNGWQPPKPNDHPDPFAPPTPGPAPTPVVPTSCGAPDKMGTYPCCQDCLFYVEPNPEEDPV